MARRPGRAAVGEVPYESQEQIVVVKWWANQAPAWGYDQRLLVASANGEVRGRKISSQGLWYSPAGIKLRAMGVRAGFPDLVLFTPSWGYHGLMIEMKRTKGGSVSTEQRDYHELLSSQSYYCVVCKGADPAMKAIRDYLKIDEK